MKNKLKIVSMFVVGAISILMGFTNVYASTLVQTPIDDVYYTRRGGGQGYLSAKYNTYAMNGKTVYCIEPGIDITTHSYAGAEGWINSPYSKAVNQKIQLIGYYGYDYPSHNTLRYRMAAQALIWETVGGQIVEYWTEQYGYGNYINVDREKNNIMALVNDHYQVPSFNGNTKTSIIGQETTFADSNNVLSQYEVYKSENANSSINGNTLSVTPNVVGEVIVSLLRKSYTSDPTTIFVGIDSNSQKMGFFGLNDPIVSSIKLNVLGGKVSLQKVDSETLLPVPRGNGELKNAIYGIYDENDIRVGQIITDENASGTSDYLPALKRYYLKEEVNSLGYTLDNTKYWFELTDEVLNPNVKVYEKAIERDIELFKVLANASTTILVAEPNVTFEFYLKSNMELYETAITNEKGRLVVTLPYGVYIVKQITSTPNYEKVDDFEITIDNNSVDPITKIISNAEITSKLKLVKVDKDSNRTLVKDGIKFKLKNLDTNEYVCQNITYPSEQKVCTFETKNGYFITPYVLKSSNYQIEELENQTIDGYLWNSTPLTFSITENSDFIYDEEFGVMLEVTFSNEQVKGEFDITKYGEQLIIKDGTFNYEKIKLDGVSYDLYADGDIYSQDGTLIYKDKELIKSFNTIDGYHKETNLYLGNYCLIESNSVLNHIIDEKPYCFSLEYKDQYTPIVSISFELKNYLPKGTLIFNKTDLVTGEPISDTLIEIYTDSDELIFSGRTDSNGNITIPNLFITKGYIIEKEASTNYIITDEKVYFEITEDGEIVKANMTNEKEVFEVPNTSIANSKTLNIITTILAIAGIGFIIYDKKRKK